VLVQTKGSVVQQPARSPWLRSS